MSKGRLYCRDLAPGTLALSAEESHHAVTVLRVREGAEVVLFDGAGGEAEGVVDQAGRRGLVVRVERVHQRPFELPIRLTLAIALPRMHRQSYVIEKCTELCLYALQPIIAERSVSRPEADAVEKWSRRAIEAAKQSDRAWLPVIESPVSLASALARAAGFDRVWIADTAEQGVTPISDLAAAPLPRTLLALVGPEGGWTAGEISSARSAGANSVALSPTILRTETAAMALCAAVAMAGLRREPRVEDLE